MNKARSSFSDGDHHVQIVSIAGGGFLGLFSAEFLRHVEIGGIDLFKTTDLFAGTSVGSLIALALAAEVPASTIVEQMIENGEKIFPDLPALPFGGPMVQQAFRRGTKAPYKPDPLRAVLDALVGNKKLGELKRQVVVPAVDLSSGGLKIFRGGTDGPDADRRMIDVALASCAAPTYFPIHWVGDELYADGGLIANAPDALAAAYAMDSLGARRSQTRMPAVGTTLSKPGLTLGQRPRDLGILDWAGPLLEFSGFGQVQLSRRLTSTLLGEEQILVIDPMRNATQNELVALDQADKTAKQTLKAIARSEMERLSIDRTRQRFLDLWRHHEARHLL